MGIRQAFMEHFNITSIKQQQKIGTGSSLGLMTYPVTVSWPT